MGGVCTQGGCRGDAGGMQGGCSFQRRLCAQGGCRGDAGGDAGGMQHVHTLWLFSQISELGDAGGMQGACYTTLSMCTLGLLGLLLSVMMAMLCLLSSLSIAPFRPRFTTPSLSGISDMSRGA